MSSFVDKENLQFVASVGAKVLGLMNSGWLKYPKILTDFQDWLVCLKKKFNKCYARLTVIQGGFFDIFSATAYYESPVFEVGLFLPRS